MVFVLVIIIVIITMITKDAFLSLVSELQAMRRSQATLLSTPIGSNEQVDTAIST